MDDKSVRLSTTSYAVLALIEFLGEATSYDLKRSLERSIQNFWPVPHTTAYDEPARLAAGGYLSQRQEEGGRRRKVYALTDGGRAALDAWRDAPLATPPQLRDEAVLKIFAGAEPEPIVADRAGWHRMKLEELHGYLEAVRAAGKSVGVERSLLAGIRYHEAMLEVIDAFLAQRAGSAGA